MKAKLIVEGKEFDIEINDPELVKLIKPPKKTGYERAEEETRVYYVGYNGEVNDFFDNRRDIVNDAYIAGNYYSDRTVAENNARADELMRQLRRFAVEHRKSIIDWNNSNLEKYSIRYDHNRKEIRVDLLRYAQIFGAVWFDNEQAADLAIETFHNELIWYFTEYKDSL